jgi:adenine/guanine phosphoribosyltransferase-like PRPP-binding protein
MIARMSQQGWVEFSKRIRGSRISGASFYDITTLLRDPEWFKASIEGLAAPFAGAGIEIVVGIESRGFILGGAVADRLGRAARSASPEAAREDAAQSFSLG